MLFANCDLQRNVREGEVRARWLPGLESAATLTELPEEALAALATRVEPLLSPSQREPAHYAAEIRALWELASQHRAGWLATAGLLTFYAVSCLGVRITFVVWFAMEPPTSGVQAP